MSAEPTEQAGAGPRTALDRLLAPESIAIVGTSQHGGRGTGLHRNLLCFGYAGRLYAVNPKYTQVLDTPCYPSIAALPEVPDCAAIALSAESAVQVVEECARMGIRGAILFASGFAEAGEAGKVLQRQLTQVAHGAGMAVCGPNCFGLMNLCADVVAVSGSLEPPIERGDIAFVSQSGGLSLEVGMALMERGVGFSHVVSSGNEAVTTAEDYLAHLVEDSGVGMLLAIVEGLRRPRLFVEVAKRALELGKPFVVLKLGRSETGMRAVGSHTGSLAGDDAVLGAVLSTWGVVRVGSVDELIETAALFARRCWPASGRGVVFASASGGRSALIADLAAEAGLPLAGFAPGTRARLREVLPDFATVDNPLDMTGAVYDRDGLYEAALGALAADPGIGLLAVYQGTRPTDSGHSVDLAACVGRVAQVSGKSVVTFTTLGSGAVDPNVRNRLADYNIPLLMGAANTVRAVFNGWRHGIFVDRGRHSPEAGEVPTAARPLVEQVMREGALSEFATEQMLAAYGVPVARGGVVATVDEAIQLAAELGYPVAVKACSARLLHKARFGLVRLNVQDAQELETAFREVWRNDVEGMLVQAMVPAGVEVLIGAKQTQFGPVVVFGAGGAGTELERDVSLRLAPVARQEALEMVFETRVGPRVGTSDGLLNAIVAVSRLAVHLGDVLRELDVNPLIVGPGAVTAVDALLQGQAAVGQGD